MRLSAVIGRRSQMLKVKGTTVYPPALFDVLDPLPEVANYVVEAFTNELGTDEIKILVGTNIPSEELQKKIGDYDVQVAELQKQLQETKVKAAIKVALLSEKAVDVDYLTFKLNEKLKEKNEALELDENDNIKGWDDKLSGLKTQFPSMFESASKDGYKVLGDNRLPEGDRSEVLTKESLLKKPYAERAKIASENPEAYNTAMKS